MIEGLHNYPASVAHLIVCQTLFEPAPGRNRKEDDVIKTDRPEYDERAFKKKEEYNSNTAAL
jgi:hypothetical protein